MTRRPSSRIGHGLRAVLIVIIGLSVHSCKAQRIHVAQASEVQAAEAPATVIEVHDPFDLVVLQERFQGIARSVAPMVVAISAAAKNVENDSALRAEELNPDRLSRLLARTTRTVGTGFFIDSDGYILTNEHVIGDAEQLWITTDDRKVYPALVVGSDPRSDLAVLKIPASQTPAVSFADLSTVERGQWALALGNPYGLAAPGEMSLSVGVVSATNRSLPRLANKENRQYSNLIQSTTPINPGSSGGPLFDLNGSVIGVNTAVILAQRSSNGIGFAMPITPRVLAIMDDLKQGREVVYGYLGVVVSTPTTRERRQVNLEQEIGARIDSIERGTPAAESALRDGDIIVEINGEPVADADHFVRIIGATPVNRPVPLRVIRAGGERVVEVMLRPRQLPAVAVTRETQRFRWRGLLLGPVPVDLNAEESAATGGLMVFGIDTGSPLVERVTNGSIITAVAGVPVRSILELQRVINDTPEEKWEVEVAGASSAVVSIQH